MYYLDKYIVALPNQINHKETEAVAVVTQSFLVM